MTGSDQTGSDDMGSDDTNDFGERDFDWGERARQSLTGGVLIGSALPVVKVAEPAETEDDEDEPA